MSETLRHRCRNVRRTLQHRCRSNGTDLTAILTSVDRCTAPVPKCLDAEVSWCRSVRTPPYTGRQKSRLPSDLVLKNVPLYGLSAVSGQLVCRSLIITPRLHQSIPARVGHQLLQPLSTANDGYVIITYGDSSRVLRSASPTVRESYGLELGLTIKLG